MAARLGTVLMLIAVLASSAACGSVASMMLEVRAGQYDRSDTPILWELPSGVNPAKSWRLVDISDNRQIPLQLLEGEPATAVWIMEGPLPAGATRRYRLEPGVPSLVPSVTCRDEGGKHLVFRVGKKEIIRYNYGRILPPEGVDPVFARSGYVHPVRTPSGLIVSNDFPGNHKHHHGIWFPHTRTEFEGRKIDFWNQKEKQGRVECLGVDGAFSGPVCAGFRSRHRFVDQTAPEGEKEVLHEVWEVRVYALEKFFLFDLLSVQTCAGSSPLKLLEYRYGGLGFRGSGEWEGEQGVEFLTSEGKTRKDGHATAARWCNMTGKVQGKQVGIGFLCHPENFRFPQNMRIHPSEPFFNWAPCQTGDFVIAPGDEYVSRYRFVVRDGDLGSSETEARWRDYGVPPEVVVVGSN